MPASDATSESPLREPPFSRLDLLTCRNLLIYLEKGLQDRVCELFRDALRENGYLFLGESETAPEHQDFRAPDRERRIFQREHGPSDAERVGLPELPLDGGGTGMGMGGHGPPPRSRSIAAPPGICRYSKPMRRPVMATTAGMIYGAVA